MCVCVFFIFFFKNMYAHAQYRRLLHFCCRLKEELEEKHDRWLSCRQRCDATQEQLSLWQQREEQMSRKHCAAQEEVTRQREALGNAEQEARELRRERWRVCHVFSILFTSLFYSVQFCPAWFCSVPFHLSQPGKVDKSHIGKVIYDIAKTIPNWLLWVDWMTR